MLSSLAYLVIICSQHHPYPCHLRTIPFLLSLVLPSLCLQLLVAGGAMYVEVFNRGVIPLAYSIRKRNSRTGLPSTYYDGIYLLITYFTKPESMDALQLRLNADDDVIRSTSFKVRQRKAV